jgi:hypothetical protein
LNKSLLSLTSLLKAEGGRNAIVVLFATQANKKLADKSILQCAIVCYLSREEGYLYSTRGGRVRARDRARLS